MNSPEMHLADKASADEESDEIRLLRTQVADLCLKAKALHAKWWIVLALAAAGFLVPIGFSFLYGPFSAQRYDYQARGNERMYFKRVLLAADVRGVAHGELPEDLDLAHKMIFELKNKISVATERMPLALPDLVMAEEERARKSHDMDKQFAALDDVAGTMNATAIICAPWLLPLIYLSWVSWSRKMMERTRYKLEFKIVEAKARHLQDKIGEDFFTRLVQINFKYLDQYYFQTHQQANKSFVLSVAAAIVGLLIIVASIVMILADKQNPAILAGVAGTLSQFIAAVFFYLYNRTVLKMGEYHKKLVLTQNIGIALKITDLLPVAEKAETQRALVGQLTFNINQFLSEIESGAPAPAPVPAR